MPPVGVRLAFVRMIGVGRALPVESWTTVGAVSSVMVKMAGLPVLVNSKTVPVTWTLLPMAAAAGGAEAVSYTHLTLPTNREV